MPAGEQDATGSEATLGEPGQDIMTDEESLNKQLDMDYGERNPRMI